MVWGGPFFPDVTTTWMYPALAALLAPRSQCESCNIVPVVAPAAEQLRTLIPAARPKLMPRGFVTAEDRMRSSPSTAVTYTPNPPGLRQPSNEAIDPQGDSQVDRTLHGMEPVATPAPTDLKFLNTIHWWKIVDDCKKEYFEPL
eukprot:2467385-Pyramimonas_sp.AAC.1